MESIDLLMSLRWEGKVTRQSGLLVCLMDRENEVNVLNTIAGQLIRGTAHSFAAEWRQGGVVVGKNFRKDVADANKTMWSSILV